MSSKQVGQWSSSERTAGELLTSSHLPWVPEGGAVDDLGSVASSMQPGVEPAQGRLPLHPPLGPPSCDSILCCLSGWIQEPQRVQVAREDSGKPPATPPTTATVSVFIV